MLRNSTHGPPMGFLQKIARSESPQFSANPDVFRIDVSPVPGGGMACFAARDLSDSDTILTVKEPAASVIMKKFRKEVCAWCYSYAINSNLRIKVSVKEDRGIAWFCSLECRDSWMKNVGDAGWEAICAFEDGLGRTKGPCVEHADIPCGSGEVETLWEKALQDGNQIMTRRLAKPRSALKTATLPANVDIDVARFILSSFIPLKNAEDVDVIRRLVPTLAPYTSSQITIHQHIQIYHYLLSVLPIASPILASISPVNIASLVTRDAGNSWGVWDEALAGDELFAYCLYPTASYFNHSCTPNVTQRRLGRTYSFHVKDNVALGDELNVSYLGEAVSKLSFQERQKKLLVSVVYHHLIVLLIPFISLAGASHAHVRDA